MQKTIILNEKEYLIKSILKYVKGDLEHNQHIENYLNKKDIKDLKTIRKKIKPRNNPFNKKYLPRQKILSNKDIVYNSLVKPLNNKVRKQIGKHRFKKIIKFGYPLFKREKEQVKYSIMELINKGVKSKHKKIRQKEGVTFNTMVNNELRSIIIKNSKGLNSLIQSISNEKDFKFINKIITREVKKTQKENRLTTQ